MNLIIASTFQSALSKLNNAEQKAVKLTVFDLHQNLASPSFQFHKIGNAKDANFWSLRVNRDIRLIAHKAKSSILIVYVDHHDKAYKWAEGRRIEVHPSTGVTQIVELTEVSRDARLSEVGRHGKRHLPDAPTAGGKPENLPLSDLSAEEMLSVGVPENNIGELKNATEEQFLRITDHLPEEAAEALLEYILTGQLKLASNMGPTGDSFKHLDAQRRFRVVTDDEDITKLLDYPWEKWTVYLHPTQNELIKKKFSGPARITGSAGTGKTVVALHRAAQTIESDATAKVLLTTFSSTLSRALEYKLNLILGKERPVIDTVSVLPFGKVAEDLFTLTQGRRPNIASRDIIEMLLNQAKEEFLQEDVSLRFLMSEWRFVVDAWQVDSLQSYGQVPRIGRKKRLGKRQRELLWPLFERVQSVLSDKQLQTSAMVFEKVTQHYNSRAVKPYTHIVVDEAQDLGVAELKMIRALAPAQPNSLVFVGDLGQRISQEAFSWLKLGVDVRGRSHALKVNYRTTHQIRKALDKLHPSEMHDVDGVSQLRRGTVSTFNGDAPTITIFPNDSQEVIAVAKSIRAAISDGIPAEEIGVFVRSTNELARARNAISQSGQKWIEISSRIEDRNGRVSLGLMHYSKGLEFRSVFVMACDERVMPNLEEVRYVSDEIELDELHDTERNLFYVACTRAREHLTVTGVSPGSELVSDLMSSF